jgi:hypothetical protein
VLLGESDFLPAPLASQLLERQAGGPVGIGFFVEGEGDSLRFGHGGSNEGFRAQMWMYRASGDGAVVMTNSDKGQQLAAEILATIAAANGWPGYLAPEIEVRALPPATLDKYVGTWTTEKFPPATVTRSADGLTFELQGDRPLRMLPLGPEEFALAESDARIRFPGAPGAIRTMEARVAGLTIVFQRARGD